MKGKLIKKASALILVAALLASMLSIGVSAEGIKLNSGIIRFNIYKADPANIVKDGIIGENEYHRLDVSRDPDKTKLYIIFGRGSTAYDDAMAMLETMEYYFSWDEVHGLNLAVRCAPRDLVQLLDINKTGTYPEDGFLNNCALGISVSDTLRSNDEADILFYAIGRRTDDGRYLQGWYNQLGYNQDYSCKAEEDFVIEYSDDGYVTYEWSIPMEYFMQGSIEPGRSIFMSLFAMSGTAKEVNYTDCYGISLGDRCYLRITTDETAASVGVLSSTKVEDAFNLDDDVKLSSFFDDTEDDAWYSKDVMEAYYLGLIQGKGNRKFEPEVGMTRAELVTLIYRNEEKPKVSYSPWFDDVSDDDWFSEAVCWAARTGIVNGYDGKFDPNEFITREQIATILFRYARYKRETTTGVVDKLDSFLDKEKISDYAYEALAWANHNGIILGKPSEGGNIIDPLANATRAEVSTMMIRYVDKYND